MCNSSHVNNPTLFSIFISTISVMRSLKRSPPSFLNMLCPTLSVRYHTLLKSPMMIHGISWMLSFNCRSSSHKIFLCYLLFPPYTIVTKISNPPNFLKDPCMCYLVVDLDISYPDCRVPPHPHGAPFVVINLQYIAMNVPIVPKFIYHIFQSIFLNLVFIWTWRFEFILLPIVLWFHLSSNLCSFRGCSTPIVPSWRMELWWLEMSFRAHSQLHCFALLHVLPLLLLCTSLLLFIVIFDWVFHILIH